MNLFRKRTALLALLYWVLGTQPAAAEILQGRVVRVIDGDTIVLLVDARDQVRVRLSEIDAPEKHQPWGRKSKKSLAAMIAGKLVKVDTAGKDRYRRILGRIYKEGRDINRAMILSGNAWAYRKYVKDHSLLDAEKIAREEHRGLWGLPEYQRVPPWEWRRRSSAR